MDEKGGFVLTESLSRGWRRCLVGGVSALLLGGLRVENRARGRENKRRL